MKTILVVDDDAIHLAICKAHLSRDYEVVTALSGVQALGYIRAVKVPDLILLDLFMPTVGGLEILAQLKENEIYRNIPVIFLTSAEDIPTIQKGLKAGASDFLFKPVDPELIHRKVAHWLGYTQLQEENKKLRGYIQSIRDLVASMK